jgi:hypothetical protein
VPRQRIELAYQLLRVTLGLMALVAGVDTFVGLLADWERYLAPPLRIGPGGGRPLMLAAGVLEAIIGLGVLAGRARVFGYALCGWLVLAAADLVLAGYLDVALRDAALAAAAFALAELALARREPGLTPTPAPGAARPGRGARPPAAAAPR